MEDRIKILGSTEMMRRIVDSIGLNVTYTQEGHVMAHELFDDSPVKLLFWNTQGVDKNFQIKIKSFDSLRFRLFRTATESELVNYGVPFSFEKRELVLKKVSEFSDNYPIIIAVHDKYAVAELYSSKLEIAQQGRSNILNISMIDQTPEKGIAIINRLVHEYGAATMESKSDAGSRTMNFIQQRLNYVASELYSVEKKEEGFKKDKRF